MHAWLLLRASLRVSAQCACSCKGAEETARQFILHRHASTLSAAATPSGEGTNSQSGTKRNKLIFYPAAAAIALTSVAAAKAHQQPSLQGEEQPSSLLDTQWVQDIPQQQNVLQVLSAKSIETHALLTRDHIVSYNLYELSPLLVLVA